MGRTETVAAAAEQWAKQLTDPSGKNRLLYYWPLTVGTLGLDSADPAAMRKLLTEVSGTPVALSALFPRAPDGVAGAFDDAVRRARAIGRKATENFEERGVSTLFLVQGMATWTRETPGRTPAAPVLMCTVELRRRGASETDFDLSLDGEWTVNGALIRHLESEFEVAVSGEELIGSKLSDGQLDESEVTEVLDDLLAAAEERVPDFEIDRERRLLGNFMYRKMPMVSDILENLAALSEHDLITATAGDPEARDSVRREHAGDIDPSRPDATAPSDEFLVLDADSSQNAAINAALDGESFVLRGPPGTGKSQTIANVIAAMMARGQRVLFVAEKRAAIDAVTKRLKAVGLDKFVMDFHGGTLRRRELARRLDESLEEIFNALPVEQSALFQSLEESRAALSRYADALHRLREPWGLSYFDVLRRLLEIDKRRPEAAAGPTEQSGFPLDVLHELDSTKARDVRRDLRKWADLAEPALSSQSPWFDSRAATPEHVSGMLQLLPALTMAIPDAQTRARELLDELALEDPGSLEEWNNLFELLSDVAEVGAQLSPAVFARDLDRLVADLAPASRGPLTLPARLLSRRYRAALKEIQGLSQQAGKLAGREALRYVERACELARTWGEHGGRDAARVPSNVTGAFDAYEEVRRLVDDLAIMIPELRLHQRPYAELAELVRALTADEPTLLKLPQLFELDQRIAAAGVRSLIGEVRSGELPADAVVDAFDRAWLTSIRRQVVPQEPSLAAFDHEDHDRSVREFRECDISHLSNTPARVRHTVALHAVEERDRYPDQSTLLTKEAKKRKRHLPLRRLFEEAPDVLTAVKPCWTMSPLDVAQTLPARALFDLVIFDEASQVLPCDAISALLRAPRVMVAGDPRQLPPTTFFDGASDDEDDDPEDNTESLADFESILDVMETMLRLRQLTWHYRSEDERLIAFSNNNIYDRSLTTFPGAADEECLTFEYVEHRPGEATETRSNPSEVRRVVDLMIDHARRCPDESLGVIAMGRYHADRIEETLRRRLAAADDPTIDEFFDQGVPERAFVKNLERVQGDERDAIILTVGYGKTAHGVLRFFFGPLNNAGGERRLNVAVTRARRRMTLVSSFTHTEMPDDKVTAEGVRLLRDYLKYVDSGGTNLSGFAQTEPLNPFEVDVKDKLIAAGLSVVPQYGCSGYRIDFAVRHPDNPRRFVLAVEADGASYHSSNTARDRDRLRQDHLERLGWRFCRIWSTDWFNNHTAQVDKVLRAVEEARLETDAEPLRPQPEDHAAERDPLITTLDSDPASPTIPENSDRGDHTSNPTGSEAPDPSPGSPERGPPPWIPRGVPIGEQWPKRLVDLAKWVESDERNRTEEEVIEEMFQHSGYQRKGRNIMATLRRALKQAREEDDRE